jgi:tripartite tricarboxylate transporter TctB family protein
MRKSRRSSSGSDHEYVRPYQVATAAAIVVIAAVAMFDSRAAFSPSAGTQVGDVGARWYPFWAATLMGIASVVVAYRALTTPQAAEGVFHGSRSLLAVAKLVIPMFAYVLLIGGIGFRTTEFTYRIVPQFGFYLATALYMGLFAWWLGRYKIWWVALITVAFPIVIFAVFELGFRVSLPKSFLYTSGVLPF